MQPQPFTLFNTAQQICSVTPFAQVNQTQLRFTFTYLRCAILNLVKKVQTFYPPQQQTPKHHNHANPKNTCL